MFSIIINYVLIHNISKHVCSYNTNLDIILATAHAKCSYIHVNVLATRINPTIA